MQKIKVLGESGPLTDIPCPFTFPLVMELLVELGRKVQNGGFTSQSQIGFLPQPTNAEVEMSHNKD